MSAGALDIDLVHLFFDAANMDRWNDHIKPLNLTELDKQAHKAAIAWYLGKLEEACGNTIDWRLIIENGMFSFIQRTILTDLKPTLFHRIKKERAREINDYVMSEFKKRVPNADSSFSSRLEEFLRKDDRKPLESQVLRAAHYLATKWEFDFIYDINARIHGIEKTKENIESQIGQHAQLAGVRTVLNSEWKGFPGLMAQLRFQKRWTRTPRIPETTVLGHSLLVANMIFLHDLDLKSDGRTKYNNYYAALFHDLPEVLTKDVISPVKTNVGGLVDILTDYEMAAIEADIIPLLESEWVDEFKFLVIEPFLDKNDPVHGKLNGRDIKACDMMAAFLEAQVSLRYGITSATLREGAKDLREKLLSMDTTIDVSELISRFDGKEI